MIIRFVLLVLATACTLLFLINLKRGSRYKILVENLDPDEYFLKDIYVVGFALNGTKLFMLRGNVAKELRKNSKLINDNMYAEYYADLAWAQFLSLSLAVICVGLSFASLFASEAAFLFVGIVVLFILAIWNLCMSKMKEAVQKRRDDCVLEFPNMVSKLSLLINSGMILREAWNTVAFGKDGPLYDLMKKSCEYMENGESDSSAIHKFGVLCDAQEIKKFTSAMIQGIEKGNSELADFLIEQSSELWAHKRQLALQKGEIAAGKLVIPLGIMFAGIIMIIVAAAMQSLSF